jgi:hypothetical protein
MDRVAARDLVERVDRERRRPVGRGKQIRVDAQRGTRRQVRGLQILVDAMRPDDLFGCREAARVGGIRPVDRRRRQHGFPELAAADLEDAAAAPDLLFLGRERHRIVALALRDVGEVACRRIEGQLVAVLRVRHRFGTLHDVQPEVERVAPEDVPHVVAAHDDQLQPDLFRHTLQPRRAHLARRADGEPIPGDHERLAAVDARAEIRHQVAERSRLPPFVERLEALRHAVGGRRDLIGIDGVALLWRRALRVPEDEGASADQPVVIRRRVVTAVVGDVARRHAGPQSRRLDGVHDLSS